MPSLGRMALAAPAASSSARLLRRLPVGVLLVGRGMLVGVGVGEAGLGVDAAAGADAVGGVGDGGLEGGFGVDADEGLVVGVEVGLEN